MRAARPFGVWWVVLAVACASVPGSAGARDGYAVEPAVRRVLAARCTACHRGKDPAGGLDLPALVREDPARRRRTWREVLERVEANEMPPPEKPPLAPADRDLLSRAITTLLAPPAADNLDPGPPLIRRLSRDEYARTIRDLFGIDFDAAAVAGIPDESQGNGFANRADVLALSPALMEKYFTGAEAVLDVVLAATPPPKRPRRPPARPRAEGGLTALYRCAGAKPEDNQIRAVVQVANAGAEPVPLADLTLRYWFTADGVEQFQQWCDYAAVDAKNVMLSVHRLDKAVHGADAYVEVAFKAGMIPPGGTTGDVQLRIAAVDWAAFDQANDHSFDPGATNVAAAPRVTVHRRGRTVWGVEPSGEPQPPPPPPPTPDAIRAWERVFVSRPGKGLSARTAASRVLTAFARRAWRRPVAPGDIDGLLAVFDKAAAAGGSFEASVRPALAAALVSPRFLLRMERDEPAGPAAAHRQVDDHELAVRLSYFIWSSMPDDELFAAAERGDLRDDGGVARQVHRMLADPRAAALTESFFVPWLQIGRLATARPTPEFFPAFTAELRRSMRDEATAFLDNLRTENRSLVDLLDSDYTFVNEELARHYGLAGIAGREMRRVGLAPDDHRGGVLGMAAVLAATSHTFRTSPTLRGKYVLEVLLGDPPPPPPANAGVLANDPAAAPPATFRESLVRHARDPSCAVCHARIDPLGFGLEHYDGIGRWRGDQPGIDASGRLPGGVAFSGPAELKAILLTRKSRFLRHACGQMLAFALGRPLEECDEPALDAITEAVEGDDGRFSTLVTAVAESVPFQHRRNRAAAAAVAKRPGTTGDDR